MASIWGPAMTEASIPVTQSVVERFTEQYLQSLGCDIEKERHRWNVTVPEDADTELPKKDLTLVCETDAATDNDGEKPLYPDSQFFQQLLTEVSKRTPTGKISIETQRAGIEVPEWIRGGEIEVSDTRFTPYYDRTALGVLFRVSIETVSEYQSEFLHAIAVDTRSEEQLPKLEDAFLSATAVAEDVAKSTRFELAETDVRPLLDEARELLIERVQPTVDEIHREASRVADAEVEEYRQMQQQRLEELSEKHASLSAKLEEMGEKINSSEQTERVQVLKERKELKSEYDKIDTELTELRQQRDQGFPERQQEIRERHALDVRIFPLTLTQIEYERGEIEFELIEGTNTRNMTLGYGSGVGVTDEVLCSNCSKKITQDNPLQSLEAGFRCTNCTLDRN